MIFFIIIGIIILVSLIVSESSKNGNENERRNKSNLRCPVCNEKKLISDLSNARFNYEHICKKCIIKIQKKYGKPQLNNIYLEDLQNAVREYDSKQGKNSSNNYDNFNNEDDFLTFSTLEEQYEVTISKHYMYLERIEMLYSTAINMPNIDNRATKECIELCKKDIELAESFKSYFLEKQQLTHTNEDLPSYGSFYYLTRLYDKLGMIEDAIYTCAYAINLGYWKDNSKGGIPARLARLIKKYYKIYNKKLAFDENGTIYDTETGEIIKK